MPGALKYSQDMVLAFAGIRRSGDHAIDRDGRIAIANHKAEEMFGYTREELLGSSVEMLLPSPSVPRMGGRLEEYFSQPRVRPMGIGMDLARRRKDASEFPRRGEP